MVINEKMALFWRNHFFGTRDWIRTSTPFPAPPPQGGASTNFATRALLRFANLADKLISKKVKSQK